MANGTKSILEVGLSAQSIALLGENVRIAKKKKKTSKDFLSLGMKNLVGTSLLRAQAQEIGKL